MSSQFPNSENAVLSEQNSPNESLLVTEQEQFVAEHDQFEESSVQPALVTHDALLACYTQDTTVECLAVPSDVESEVICSAPVAELEEEVVTQPVAAEPIVAEPVAVEPVAVEPVAVEPVAVEPVAVEPVVAESNQEPVDVAELASAESVATEPVVNEAVAIEPVAVEPTDVEPVVAEAAAPEPVEPEATAVESVASPSSVEEPVAEQPTAEQVTAEQPIAERATVQQPAVEEPVVAEPVVAEAVAEEVVAEVPVEEEDKGFAAFPLRPEVLEAVVKSGYDTPTAIQAEIIPYMLDGRDVLAQSQTGTGKTAAFALPILTTIDTSKYHPQVLVLAPTRELAIQVARSFSTYGAKVPGFAVAAIYGGQDYEPQLKQLRRGVQVVVGTPGRVIDHVNRGTLDLGKLDCLVLDEADEMLNMGFLEDVEFVLEKTPVTRQVALFSATLPPPIRNIADEYLNDPARITIKKKTATADSIRQRALFVSPRDKIDALVRLLEVEETDGVIVFTKTKDATISVAESLTREGLSAVALNGDMPQKVRERTISQLKNGKLDILVATDVAARGLDVPRISHVFNFDLPHDTESYIHRVGRTGRAGRDGEAIIFLTNAQRTKLRHIERATKQPIEIVGIPTAKEINAMRVKRFGQQITDTTAEKDLTLFKELISNYAEETGKPLEMIAAALAEISLQGRPFMMKDRPAARSEDRGGRFDRGDHFGGSDRGGAHGRGNKPNRQLGPPREGMVRYRIEVGWQDGVKPGNIVGAVANEAGIEGQYIGPINIRDEFSTIDLPEGMPSDIYQKLRKTWVSGKRLNLEVSRDTDFEGDSRGGGYQRGGNRSGGGFRPKNGKRGAHAGPKRTFSGKPKKNKRKAKP
ncbi:ATP-dependent RNA helicase DeaD [Rhodopirellula rubra]|uniref:ATP-dependent RNA helicase DeaD n=1 Tax=Aporhodopirellula rubra TaxID=980271 RepID=A0A7W5DZS4_9BACT|nr:DEAD/DEAH box helicase [Aporhodopirellula rubra]MBB3207192.1 ATP-dependent RNA helicase DeaD [Aporhodopirellula rubra]